MARLGVAELEQGCRYSEQGRLLCEPSAMTACAAAKDWDVTAKLRTTTMMVRKS